MSFDRLAPDYDRLRTAGGHWRELAELAIGELGQPARLLDVGCGTGRFAVLAADLTGARVWGVDPSAAMLGQARRRPGGRRVGWKQAGAENLPSGTDGSTAPTCSSCCTWSAIVTLRLPSSRGSSDGMDGWCWSRSNSTTSTTSS